MKGPETTFLGLSAEILCVFPKSSLGTAWWGPGNTTEHGVRRLGAALVHNACKITHLCSAGLGLRTAETPTLIIRLWVDLSRFQYQSSGIKTSGYAPAPCHIARIFRSLPGSRNLTQKSHDSAYKLILSVATPLTPSQADSDLLVLNYWLQIFPLFSNSFEKCAARNLGR